MAAKLTKLIFGDVAVWHLKSIRKQKEYAVLDITSSAFAVSELDRQLNLNESVMRTKVVRPEARSAK